MKYVGTEGNIPPTHGKSPPNSHESCYKVGVWKLKFYSVVCTWLYEALRNYCDMIRITLSFCNYKNTLNHPLTPNIVFLKTHNCAYTLIHLANIKAKTNIHLPIAFFHFACYLFLHSFLFFFLLLFPLSTTVPSCEKLSLEFSQHLQGLVKWN